MSLHLVLLPLMLPLPLCRKSYSTNSADNGEDNGSSLWRTRRPQYVSSTCSWVASCRDNALWLCHLLAVALAAYPLTWMSSCFIYVWNTALEWPLWWGCMFKYEHVYNFTRLISSAYKLYFITNQCLLFTKCLGGQYSPRHYSLQHQCHIPSQ